MINFFRSIRGKEERVSAAKICQKLSVTGYICVLCLLVSSKIEALSENQYIRRIESHCILKDYASAQKEAVEALKFYPMNPLLWEAYLSCLSRTPNDELIMSTWTKFSGYFPECKYKKCILENLCWSILNKYASSPQFQIRFLTTLAVSLIPDYKSVQLIKKSLSDPHPLVRLGAVEGVTRLRDDLLINSLCDKLSEETNYLVKTAIFECIGRLQLIHKKDYLYQQLKRRTITPEETEALIKALISIEDTVSIDFLKFLSIHSNPHLRSLACHLAAFSEEPINVNEMIKTLTHDCSWKVRSAAWPAAGIRRLALPIPNEHHPCVAISIAWALLMYNKKLGQEQFNAWLWHTNPTWSYLAAGALNAAGPYAEPISSETLLKAKDPYLQLNLALSVLKNNPSNSAATTILHKILAQDSSCLTVTSYSNFNYIHPNKDTYKDWETISPHIKNGLIRLTLLNQLTILDYPQAKEAIKIYLRSRDWETTSLSSFLLLTEGDESTQNILEALLDDPDRNVRVQSALILALWNPKDSIVNTLINAYPVASKEEKERILEGLGYLKCPEALPFLANCLNEPFPSLRVLSAWSILLILNN